MIAVLLAGGFAKRLYPLTKDRAKPLLPVAGKPIIEYILDKLDQLDKVERIIITVNKKFEPQFRRWHSQIPHKNVEFWVEQSLKEQEKPGAIRALSQLLPEIDGNDTMIMAGDNLFTSSLKGIVEYYKRIQSPVIAVYDLKELKRVRQFATLVMDEEKRIISFEEKSEKPISTIIGTCIYVLPAKSMRSITEYLREGKNPDSPGYFIEWMFKRQAVYGYVLEGYWNDIGTPNTYEAAKQSFRTVTPYQLNAMKRPFEKRLWPHPS